MYPESISIAEINQLREQNIILKKRVNSLLSSNQWFFERCIKYIDKIAELEINNG